MAKRLTTDQQIGDFIAAVQKHAAHHVPHVAAIIVPLGNAVRRRLDLKRDTFEVYTWNGRPAQSCWVTIGGFRYAFSYNYDQRMIDLREGTLQGTALFRFDNNTPDDEVMRRISRL